MKNALTQIKQKQPLIHHITNWVTIYDCANITRTFGALPVMAHAREETEDMVKLASALVLNIGTLTTEIIESMIIAAKCANLYNIPVILDIVGVGATSFRNDAAEKIINSAFIDILKGNYSEISRLAGEDVITKGVESTQININPYEIAKKLAISKKCTVVMTGKNDIISDGTRIFVVKNGDPKMGSIVGTGCMATSVIGIFSSINSDYCDAAKDALCHFGIAGQLAAALAKGPGSFKIQLYDEISNLNEETVEKMSNVEYMNIDT